MNTSKLPKQTKIDRGTYRPSRDNKAAPEAPTGEPTPPKSLSKGGKAVWPEIMAAITALGLSSTADALSVAAFAECLAEWRALTLAINARPSMTYSSTTPAGGVIWRAYPEVAQRADCDRRLRSYLAAFGLTPADRGRVSTGQPQADADPLARFLSN